MCSLTKVTKAVLFALSLFISQLAQCLQYSFYVISHNPQHNTSLSPGAYPFFFYIKISHLSVLFVYRTLASTGCKTQSNRKSWRRVVSNRNNQLFFYCICKTSEGETSRTEGTFCKGRGRGTHKKKN